MRKRSLFAFTALLPCLAVAQGSFVRFYDQWPSVSGLIELDSHNLIGGSWIGATLMDPAGNIIQSNPYWKDSVLVQQAVRRYSNNEFYFVSGYQKDSCSAFGNLTIPFTCPVVGKMDSLGNVQAFRYYELNSAACWNLATDLEITSNKSVITWGGGGGYGIQWSFFALKADSTGELAWAKHLEHHGSFQFIKELPGGDLLAGINMDTAGAVVARLDPDGNFLWCKSYFRPRGVIHDALIESDDAFVITGFTDSISPLNVPHPPPPGYDPSLFLLELDGTGAIQWCKGYDLDTVPWHTRDGLHIVRTQDGNYVVLASIGFEHNTTYSYRNFLMKTDLNGDTLWTRSPGEEVFRYENRNLLACSDGGFLFDGYVYGSDGVLPDGGAVSYLIKTDSLGHVQCSDGWRPAEILELYPVDSSFVLSSLDGAVMHMATVQDTAFAPIVEYDGCLYNGVGTFQLRKLRVYPNPNNGRFTAEFEVPLPTGSYYSVYDATGRQLYHRALPMGTSTEAIDLSGYGRGIYLIKFSDPDAVYYERVVLE